MTNLVSIFVALLDEAVEVWRPVQAEQLGNSIYRIIDQPYDRDTERWQFEPGEKVFCELINSSDGQILAATRKMENK